MKAEEIQVGHVYFVNFDPTKMGEFNSNHMCVVLKKNRDMITFVVIPLTSQGSGAGVNKIPLYIKPYLPPHLRNKDTYAVYDQVRTVSAKRFSKLNEGDEEYDTVVPEKEMVRLYEAIISNLTESLSDAQRNELFNALFTEKR